MAGEVYLLQEKVKVYIKSLINYLVKFDCPSYVLWQVCFRLLGVPVACG